VIGWKVEESDCLERISGELRLKWWKEEVMGGIGWKRVVTELLEGRCDHSEGTCESNLYRGSRK
jgi:hypothetical protein